MANDPVIELKQLVIAGIIDTPSIIELIDPKMVEAGEELIYENIYPFNRVPPIEEEAKTYITVKADVLSNYMTNQMFKDCNVVVRVITHQSNMRVGDGRGATRIDLIGEEILKLFKSRTFGVSKLELLSSFETAVDYRHPCRVLTFQTQHVKDWKCGK